MGLGTKSWFLRLRHIINMNGTIFLGQRVTGVEMVAAGVSPADFLVFRSPKAQVD